MSIRDLHNRSNTLFRIELNWIEIFEFISGNPVTGNHLTDNLSVWHFHQLLDDDTKWIRRNLLSDYDIESLEDSWYAMESRWTSPKLYLSISRHKIQTVFARNALSVSWHRCSWKYKKWKFKMWWTMPATPWKSTHDCDSSFFFELHVGSYRYQNWMYFCIKYYCIQLNRSISSSNCIKTTKLLWLKLTDYNRIR